jgi:hypothetical protein
VRAIGHGVEEEVGERIAREVARVGQLGAKDETIAGSTPRAWACSRRRWLVSGE